MLGLFVKIFFFLISILIIFLIYFYLFRSSKSNLININKGTKVPESEFILKSENFDSDSNYALVILGKDKNPRIVVDQMALQKNKNLVKMDISLLSLFPGTSENTNGLFLFKDGLIIKKLNYKISKNFFIGDLLEYSKPINLKYADFNSNNFKLNYDLLKNNKNVFIAYPGKTEVAEIYQALDYPYVLSMKLNSVIICGKSQFSAENFIKEIESQLKLWTNKNLKSKFKFTITSSQISNPALVSEIEPFYIQTNTDNDRPEYLKLGDDFSVFNFDFFSEGQKKDLDLIRGYKFPEFKVLGCDLNERIESLVLKQSPKLKTKLNTEPNTKLNPKNYAPDVPSLIKELVAPELSEKNFRIQYFEF